MRKNPSHPQPITPSFPQAVSLPFRIPFSCLNCASILLIFLLVSTGAVRAVTFTEFTVPTANSSPQGITTGPDGNLWFAETGFSNNAFRIGRSTLAGAISEFTPPTGNAPTEIAAGPDGNLWFTERFSSQIGQVTPSGIITEFTIPTPGSQPYGITPGPDGAVWFTEYVANKIGRITPQGSMTEFPVPTPNSGPDGITTGPDGNLWITEVNIQAIARLTPTGTFTEYPLPTAGSQPSNIESGPDGNLWFTENAGSKIGRITLGGAITEFPLPSPNSHPFDITTGPDGNLWFTELGYSKIGRITTAGTITEYVIPSGINAIDITSAPDGNLWYTGYNASRIGRIILTPPNNNFASAQIIGGASGTLTDNNVAATKEPGEPDHAGNPGGASIWYRWTAPGPGSESFTTAGSGFDTLLAVYTGSSVSALSEVASNDDGPAGLVTSTVTFSAAPGTTYYIAVDGKNGAAGNITLTWMFRPLNDDFASAQTITGASGQVGNQAPPNYNPANGHYYAAVTVPSPGGTWADANAAAPSMQFGGVPGHLATITSSQETQFIINQFPGAISGGYWLGGYQDHQAPDYSEPAGGWRWVTGETWQYTNWNFGEPNNVNNIEDKLQISTGGRWNDLYAGNQVLGYLVEFEGAFNTPTALASNVGATREPGEPLHSNNGGASVWYRWTAPSSGTVTFTTAGSSFDTLLAAYTGPNLGALTSIAANDNDPAGGVRTSKIHFNALAGTTYSIAVDGLGGAAGNIILNWSIAPAPPNDNFINARGISGPYGMLGGSNLSATKEPGEPNHAGSPGGTSVWYFWTAPVTGSITFTTLGSDFDTLLAVYTGPAVDTLTSVASNDDDPSVGMTSKVTFDAVAGTTYFIAVDGYRGATGNITLSWSPRPSYWQAADLAIGSDLNARLLWGSLLGRTVLWNVNNQGQYTFGPYFGPTTGFSASRVATGGDARTRLLWNSTDGTAVLWLLDSRGLFLSGINFGPYPGWTAADIAVGSDNQARLLWTNTDGRVAVWSVDSLGNATTGPIYGPYPGWSASALAAESDDITRVLWTRTDGAVGLWLMGLDNTYQAGFAYGPYPGWSAIDIAVGIEGQARVLWTNTDGRMALWSVDNDGSILDQAAYGPYPGWTPRAISTGADTLTWVLWNHTSGQAGLWILSQKNAYETGFGYGPY